MPPSPHVQKTPASPVPGSLFVPVMSTVSSSLVPSFDVTVYLVLDDFGKLGRSYVETDEEKSDLETVVRNMLLGAYRHPVRVVASTPTSSGLGTYQKMWRGR
jgi:hypothetical protein